MADLDLLLKQITDTLTAKQRTYQRLLAYYDGDAITPLVSDRLKEVYRDLSFSVNENWSAVVVDAVADRITFEGFACQDDGAQRALDHLYEQVGLYLEVEDCFELALVCGEAYLIAGETDGEIELYANEPWMCHLFYDPQHPNVPLLACKWWMEGKERHLKTYTTTTIDHYVTTQRSDGSIGSVWEQVAGDPNPYQDIPVFHLRTHRRGARSELRHVIPLQDAINVLLTNMVVTAEFAAAPMKYVISNAQELQGLISAPNRVWHIPAGSGMGDNPQVGQFASADLGNYLSVIEHFITAVSSISRTPRHFFLHGSSQPPSGEALKTMEAPLVSKIQDRIDRFDPTFRRLGAFLLTLSSGTIPTERITCRWANPATAQPLMDMQTDKARMDVLLAKRELGVSQTHCLREAGYTEEQAQAFVEESAATAQDAGAAMLTAMSRGNGLPQG